MKSESRGRTLRTALLAALCALFFLLAIGIVLLGSNVYRGVSRTSDENFVSRTALSYLLNQVRRADCADAVSVGSFGGGDALFLRDGDWVTILYCTDGQLCELYTDLDSGLGPEDGTALLPLDALHLEQQGTLLSVTAVTADGSEHSAVIAPRCGFSGEAGA